ncbi:hypothetical protein EDB83DRAFT_1241584 [Lactarius deliciosus]|nr:hypothetical protein EDB83DRAFT_1241584 [Lactarius deliciosus]
MKPNEGVKKFTKSHRRATTEFAEGAIPPKVPDALTPIARPIELPPPEKLNSPSPPEDLPLLELPGPPSEDDTGDNLFATNLDLTTARTPRPPGAWAATPAPAPARSQTPQPTLSSIGHSRTRSNSLPQPSFTEIRLSMDTHPCSYPRGHAPRSNARTTWGLVFDTWLASTEESHESAVRDYTSR